MQESLQASQFILGKNKPMEVQLDQFEQPVPGILLSRGERTREDTNCRCELLEVGACIGLMLVTGTLFWHHIAHGWQVHEPHKKNRGSQPCSFHQPNYFWSHLSTLYMLLSCCLKRWSRLQAVFFFLLGSTTQPRDHRLSTPAIQDLSSQVSFSPILSGCCEKLYSSTLLLHRAVSRRCKPAFG